MLAQPKNRKSEFLFEIIGLNGNYFDYYQMAFKLKNLNVHRLRDFLEEENNIVFQKESVRFKNRFGKNSSFYKFKMITPIEEAIIIYNKINV